MKAKILLVDDDCELVKMLSQYLEIKGYDVLKAFNGMEAIRLLQNMGKKEEAPDLILLDINMPQMDGMEVIRQIRDKVSCPILFLTAKTEEQDMINGLRSGGDDYIRKPFSLAEMDARIASHLKREERHQSASQYKFHGGLMIDYTARSLKVDANEILLTRAEYDLVEFLSMNPGQVFDKERLYEKICGYDAEGDSRVVTELIRRIRNKLQQMTQNEYIETVWGIGYKWIK